MRFKSDDQRKAVFAHGFRNLPGVKKFVAWKRHHFGRNTAEVVKQHGMPKFMNPLVSMGIAYPAILGGLGYAVNKGSDSFVAGMRYGDVWNKVATRDVERHNKGIKRFAPKTKKARTLVEQIDQNFYNKKIAAPTIPEYMVNKTLVPKELKGSYIAKHVALPIVGGIGLAIGGVAAANMIRRNYYIRKSRNKK